MEEKTVSPQIVSAGERFIVVDGNTGEILESANGFGFKSEDSAKKYWNWKHPDSAL